MRDFFFHLQTPRGLEGAVVPVSCEGPEQAFMEACSGLHSCMYVFPLWHA